MLRWLRTINFEIVRPIFSVISVLVILTLSHLKGQQKHIIPRLCIFIDICFK